MAWKASDIQNLSGKTAIVTGANSGLGFQTALQLAVNNARVVMACRNMNKAEQSRQSILKHAPESTIEIIAVDLGDLDSVRQCADKFCAENDQLDLLINNAGIGGFPFDKTIDGFESHFGINHLGHFLFTGKLLQLLKETRNSRVVSVSSIMNRVGNHDFSDINYERKRYSSWHAYGRSKLANLLFSNELDRRFKQLNINSCALTAHPGYSSTSFQGKGPAATNSKFGIELMKISNALFAQADNMGALPTLYAALADGITGGEYIGPSFLRVRGYPVKQRALSAGYNEQVAGKLWGISEELTGFQYRF